MDLWSQGTPRSVDNIRMKCLFCKTLIGPTQLMGSCSMGGGIFVRTPTETKVYFWSPAQAKVLFSRKAEVQSPVVIGLIKQFISSFQVELSSATRREYLTEDSFEKEC